MKRRSKKRVVLSYGTLPTEMEFRLHFDTEVPDGIFSIRNDKGGADGDYTALKLYRLIKEQTAEFLDGDEEAGDFVSGVLSVLNIEWI